jgi:hypothetical protein
MQVFTPIPSGEPAMGYTRDITSHLLKELIIKWAKFVNYSKSYNFGTMPKLKKVYIIPEIFYRALIKFKISANSIDEIS